MNGNTNLNRRDFLKLLSLLPLAYFLPVQSQKPSTGEDGARQKNVLIFVFDALSALNMSPYGYHRNTTPKLQELTKKAIVYHKHYAGGNYTTPGTASLLTGTYPWTHRAIKLNNEVLESLKLRNIFNLFSTYHRVSYTHNHYADKLLTQFFNDLDEKINIWKLFLAKDQLISTLFTKDYDPVSLIEYLTFNTKTTSSYSLILSRFIKDFLERNSQGIIENYVDLFPRGVPRTTPQKYFTLEDAIDWLNSHIERFPQPFLGYFHFFPPHGPYRTRKEFVDIFKDGWKPITKPKLFNYIHDDTEQRVRRLRRHYDEFIPYVDAEFYRLFDFLGKSGFLENTIVVFTTDHGEMFEREIWGHKIPFLYQPVIHIPLIIFHPEQKERLDVVSPTSAIDLLPTLLHETGQPIPSWCEGEVLPPFNNTYPSTRSIYALEAKYIPSPHSSITQGTSMIVKGRYKLTHYFGYDELPDGEAIIELFDLDNDPEELHNLYTKNKSLANDLLYELTSRMEEADEPYK